MRRGFVSHFAVDVVAEGDHAAPEGWTIGHSTFLGGFVSHVARATGCNAMQRGATWCKRLGFVPRGRLRAAARDRARRSASDWVRFAQRRFRSVLCILHFAFPLWWVRSASFACNGERRWRETS